VGHGAWKTEKGEGKTEKGERRIGDVRIRVVRKYYSVMN